MTKHGDKAENFLYYYRLFAMSSPDLEREYRFDPVRRWRFDFAHPSSRVAVEINGNAWHVAGGGRHGKDDDLAKINRALDLGYLVFQFSPKMVERNPDYCVGIVVRNIERRLK